MLTLAVRRQGETGVRRAGSLLGAGRAETESSLQSSKNGRPGSAGSPERRRCLPDHPRPNNQAQIVGGEHTAMKR